MRGISTSSQKKRQVSFVPCAMITRRVSMESMSYDDISIELIKNTVECLFATTSHLTAHSCPIANIAETKKLMAPTTMPLHIYDGCISTPPRLS